jgi:hypothetical protein
VYGRKLSTAKYYSLFTDALAGSFTISLPLASFLSGYKAFYIEVFLLYILAGAFAY